MTPPLRRLKVPSELTQFLRHLPPSRKQKVRNGLKLILEDPRAGKPLQAELTGLWSLAVGRFRIIYRIQKKFLEIVTIGPRTTVYTDLAKRLG